VNITRRRITDSLLAAARVGHAHLFFGNVYEAVVKVPHVFAHHRDLAVGSEPKKMLQPGNPTLYFVPSGPATLAATVAAAAFGWQERRNRPWLAVSAAATVSIGLATVYVVRAINQPLFFDAEPPGPSQREILLRRWYRLNAGRVAAAGIAWYCAGRAARGADR
jgi:hypothetical protein